jgi:DNA-binding NtrC family response regulator
MKKVFGIFAIILFFTACGQKAAVGIDALIADSEKNISTLMDQYLAKGSFTKEALAEYDRIERAINSAQFSLEIDKAATDLQRTQLKQKLMDSGKRIEAIAASKGVNLAEFNKKLDLEHINFLSVE